MLTVEAAAAYLCISRGLAFAAVRDGSLPCVRIGRRILIPRRQLEALLDGTPAVLRVRAVGAAVPNPTCVASRLTARGSSAD